MSYVTHIYCENNSGLPGNGLYYTNGELRVGSKNSGRLVNICTHLDSEENTGIVSLQQKGLNFGDVFWPWFGAEAFLNVGSNKWAWGSPKDPGQSYTFGNGVPPTGRYLCLRLKMGGAINTVKIHYDIKDLYNDPLDKPDWLGIDTQWTTAVKNWRKQADHGGVPASQLTPEQAAALDKIIKAEQAEQQAAIDAAEKLIEAQRAAAIDAVDKIVKPQH